MEINVRNIFTVIKAALKEWQVKCYFCESTVIVYYSIFSLQGLQSSYPYSDSINNIYSNKGNDYHRS
jgi:hypothetical protein